MIHIVIPCSFRNCAHPARYHDAVGTSWCHVHWRRYLLMQAGILRGFLLLFSEGQPLIHNGLNCWRAYCAHASDEQVEMAWMAVPEEQRRRVDTIDQVGKREEV